MTEIWSPDGNSTDNEALSVALKQLFDEIFISIKEPGDTEQYQVLISSADASQNLISSDIGNQNQAFWQNHLENYSDSHIIILIEFFTLAEENISRWQFGSKSPVIACTKILKQRGCKLKKELLVWIKSHSTNKFLPYGPL